MAISKHYFYTLNAYGSVFNKVDTHGMITCDFILEKAKNKDKVGHIRGKIWPLWPCNVYRIKFQRMASTANGARSPRPHMGFNLHRSHTS